MFILPVQSQPWLFLNSLKSSVILPPASATRAIHAKLKGKPVFFYHILSSCIIIVPQIQCLRVVFSKVCQPWTWPSEVMKKFQNKFPPEIVGPYGYEAKPK